MDQVSEMKEPSENVVNSSLKVTGEVAKTAVGTTPNNAKKVFIWRDGRIIGHQVTNSGSAPQPGKVAIPKLVRIFSSQPSNSPLKPAPGVKVLGGGGTVLPVSQPVLIPAKHPPQPSLLPKPEVGEMKEPSENLVNSSWKVTRLLEFQTKSLTETQFHRLPQ